LRAASYELRASSSFCKQQTSNLLGSFKAFQLSTSARSSWLAARNPKQRIFPLFRDPSRAFTKYSEKFYAENPDAAVYQQFEELAFGWSSTAKQITI
jgi:hypothetical protein